MNKNLILVLVLAVLVIVSAVQTIQLVSLKDKVGSGGLSVSAATRAPQITTSSSSGAGSLDDLPSMVGGC